MNQPNNITKPDDKPTAEEVERVAEEFFKCTHPILGRPYSWLREDTKNNYRAMAKWHLTHISTLAKERDGLKELVADMSIIRQKVDTQLELEQSMRARCVEKIEYLRNNHLTYNDVEKTLVDEFLSSLPTTPNLVQQVKELERELCAVLKAWNQEANEGDGIHEDHINIYRSAEWVLNPVTQPGSEHPLNHEQNKGAL